MNPRKVIELRTAIIEVSESPPYISEAGQEALRKRFPGIDAVTVRDRNFIIALTGSHTYFPIKDWDQQYPIDYPLQ